MGSFHEWHKSKRLASEPPDGVCCNDGTKRNQVLEYTDKKYLDRINLEENQTITTRLQSYMSKTIFTRSAFGSQNATHHCTRYM